MVLSCSPDPILDQVAQQCADFGQGLFADRATRITGVDVGGPHSGAPPWGG